MRVMEVVRVGRVDAASFLGVSPLRGAGPLRYASSHRRGAARHLAPGGLLVTYGPYLEDDLPTSPGNLAFDPDLRRRNAEWGIRRRGAVEAEARTVGLVLYERVAMPANNLLLVFGGGGSSIPTSGCNRAHAPEP